MPFIGKDWRSPGEAWVKTQEGWEKKKILEVERLTRKMEESLANLYSSDEGNSDSDSENAKDCGQDMEQWQPYCHITLKSTKEVAGYNTISEAFRRLDFRNAVRDIRRFNYISKLLHLLITQNLTTLSGCATKVLFTMLEEVAWQVASNQQNIHILHLLLHDLKKTMRKYYCWGRPLGSTLLWEQHLRTIERICCMASSIEIKKPLEDGRPTMNDLPSEMIREILLRLSDYKDLAHAGQAYDVMQGLLDEQHIWRQLCKFHYTRQQIRNAIEEGKYRGLKKPDWQEMFHQLRRKFGLKEEYADCLFLCRHCRCLFWKSFGHPCIESIQTSSNEEDEDEEIQADPISVPIYIPIPPQAFLKFFSL